MMDRFWILQKKKLLIPKTWFTLLEVLIAIFVMGVGILSIVNLMTHNISIITRVHLQTTATTLAREGMEMVTNVRDTNTMLWYERNCGERSTTQDIININNSNTNQIITTLCTSFFQTGSQEKKFIIDGWLHPNISQIQMKSINDTSQAKLFLTWILINGMILTGYSHQWGSETPFVRYISFTGMNSLPNNSPLINKIIPVRSIVQYNRKGMTGEVIFESFIADQE